MGLLFRIGCSTFPGFALLLLLRGDLTLALLLFFGFAVSFALALGRLLLSLPGFLATALSITALLRLALRLFVLAALGFPLACNALFVFSDGPLAQGVFLSVSFLLAHGALSGWSRTRHGGQCRRPLGSRCCISKSRMNLRGASRGRYGPARYACRGTVAPSHRNPHRAIA